MNCAEFKDQAAAYAVGALDAGERQAMDAHLSESRHEGCLEELARMESTAQSLAESLPPVRPGPHVWKGIEKRITETQTAYGGGGKRWREALGWAVAIAAVIALFLLYRKQDETEQALNEARSRSLLAEAQVNECRTQVAAMKISDAQRDVLAALDKKGTELSEFGAWQGAPAGYSGNLVFNPELKKAFLVGNGFKPEAGKTYQLWWVDLDKQDVVPAGIAKADASGDMIAEFDPKLLETKGIPPNFAVSLETDASDAKPEQILLAAGTAPKVQ